MQVKKYEAKTMKEALDMVKRDLGPEAVILSARDLSRGFGLLGQGSIELTAAVSQNTLHKKRFAESKIRPQDRSRYSQSSAASQKKFIHRSVDSYLERVNEDLENHKPKYIQIMDEEENQKASLGPVSTDSTPDIALSRVRTAARQALSVSEQQFSSQTTQDESLQKLKQENEYLKNIIGKMQGPGLSLHPGLEFGISYDLSSVFGRLTKSGVVNEDAAALVLECQKS